MIGRVEAFLSLIRHAAPALFRSFYPLTSCLGPVRSSVIGQYFRISAVNFSQDVLSAKPTALAVLTVWSEATWVNPVAFSPLSHASESRRNGTLIRLPRTDQLVRHRAISFPIIRTRVTKKGR